MLKLYGAPLSNYYNMVKISLLEKRLPFEEVLRPPTQEADYLVKSPMGKIPTLETERGFITETHAILDYLEDAYPRPAFLPADPFARAKVRELTQAIELYIELVARRGFGVLFGRPVPDDVKAGIKPDLVKGVAALKRLLQLKPWVAGQDMSYAGLCSVLHARAGQSVRQGERRHGPCRRTGCAGMAHAHGRARFCACSQRSVRRVQEVDGARLSGAGGPLNRRLIAVSFGVPRQVLPDAEVDLRGSTAGVLLHAGMHLDEQLAVHSVGFIQCGDAQIVHWPRTRFGRARVQRVVFQYVLSVAEDVAHFADVQEACFCRTLEVLADHAEQRADERQIRDAELCA